MDRVSASAGNDIWQVQDGWLATDETDKRMDYELGEEDDEVCNDIAGEAYEPDEEW